MTESIFVMSKANQVFNFEFFRSITNNIRMMCKVQHFEIIKIIADAQGAFLVNAGYPANLFNTMRF